MTRLRPAVEQGPRVRGRARVVRRVVVVLRLRVLDVVERVTRPDRSVRPVEDAPERVVGILW